MIDEQPTSDEPEETLALTHHDLRSEIYLALQARFHLGRLVRVLDTYGSFDVGRRSVVYLERAPTTFTLVCYEDGELLLTFEHVLDASAKDLAVKQAFLFLTNLFAIQELHDGIETLYSEPDLDEPEHMVDIVTFRDGSTGTRRYDQHVFQIRAARDAIS